MMLGFCPFLNLALGLCCTPAASLSSIVEVCLDDLLGGFALFKLSRVCCSHFELFVSLLFIPDRWTTTENVRRMQSIKTVLVDICISAQQ